MVQQMPVAQISKSNCRYFGRQAVLTTKHGKADALEWPLKAALGLGVRTIEIDTDVLGTFTGEIERVGTPIETVKEKARLGMRKTGAKLGLANEGSFGAYPYMPLIPGCQEVIVLIDDELGIEVIESIVSPNTNFSHLNCRSIEEAEDFLARVNFPKHGLIVRPNKYSTNLIGSLTRVLTGGSANTQIRKGIQSRDLLIAAIESCRKLSSDGLAHIETDMRAHMNPTRLRVIRTLGIKLAKRLRCTCPDCDCPGFGITGVEGSLRCRDCGYPSESPAFEIHSCPKCKFKKTYPRKDGVTSVEARHCQRCNP